jgi:hypothetical protein
MCSTSDEADPKETMVRLEEVCGLCTSTTMCEECIITTVTETKEGSGTGRAPWQ